MRLVLCRTCWPFEELPPPVPRSKPSPRAAGGPSRGCSCGLLPCPWKKRRVRGGLIGGDGLDLRCELNQQWCEDFAEAFDGAVWIGRRRDRGLGFRHDSIRTAGKHLGKRPQPSVRGVIMLPYDASR